MLTWLINLFFGCRHKRFSFPLTTRGKTKLPEAATLTGTYVSCLDCGKEFSYDWNTLRTVTPRQWRKLHA